MDRTTDAGVLYERYHAALHAFCVRKVGDREEAADVVQDAFLNAWLALRRGFEPEAPYAWLLTIARNLCVSRHRTKSSRIQAVHFDEERDPRVSEECPTDDLIELGSLLHRLPERQRRAFLLHEVKGLPYGEVAAELELSYATVATLVFRTRRKLAQGLAAGNTAEEKPRRSLVGAVLGMLQPVLGSATPVKVAAALGVAPLVVLPSYGLDRGGDAGPDRTVASALVEEAAPGDRPLTVSARLAFSTSPTHRSRRRELPAAAAPGGPPTTVRPASERAKPAAPPRGSPVIVEADSHTPPLSATVSPNSTDSAPTKPPASPRAGDASRVSSPPRPSAPLPRTVPTRQVAAEANPDSSVAAAQPDSGPAEQGNGPPTDPGSQGNGPPADPGSQGQENGPPTDPGSQGNGPPVDPGSQGRGDGPPTDPGSQGNGPPADPGSQGQENGPPTDPGSQGNGPPTH